MATKRMWNAVPLSINRYYAHHRLPDGSITYVLRCTITHRLKIGTTKTDPVERLRLLQPGSPTQLELFASLTVSEFEAHADLSAHRLHGEWFEGEDYVYDYVDTNRVWGTGENPVKDTISEAKRIRLQNAQSLLDWQGIQSLPEGRTKWRLGR